MILVEMFMETYFEILTPGETSYTLLWKCRSALHSSAKGDMTFASTKWMNSVNMKCVLEDDGMHYNKMDIIEKFLHGL